MALERHPRTSTMSSDEEEVLPSFDLVEIDDTIAEARTARILKARQAATTYSAKIEEAGVRTSDAHSLY